MSFKIGIQMVDGSVHYCKYCGSCLTGGTPPDAKDTLARTIRPTLNVSREELIDAATKLRAWGRSRDLCLNLPDSACPPGLPTVINEWADNLTDRELGLIRPPRTKAYPFHLADIADAMARDFA